MIIFKIYKFYNKNDKPEDKGDKKVEKNDKY